MKRTRQNTSSAVMAQRHLATDSLDFLPTPPWATRALCERVLPLVEYTTDFTKKTAWDPCAGEGHMSEVLKEYFGAVRASDVHDYGKGYEVGSFIGDGADTAPAAKADWLFFNPPFNKALEFIERAHEIAPLGIAALVRTSFLEGLARYNSLYSIAPPMLIAQYVERVPMCVGRWDTRGSTATSYCWLVWTRGAARTGISRLMWIPPGCRKALTRPDDVPRFAAWMLEAAP